MSDLFCTTCGARNSGNQYCQNCGTATRFEPFTSNVPPIIPEPILSNGNGQKSGSRRWWIVAAAAILVAASVGVTISLTAKSDPTSAFPNQVGTALAPVFAQDKVVATSVSTIGPTTSKLQLHAAFVSGSSTIVATKTQIDLLRAQGGDLALRDQVDDLLIVERQWMNKAATTVLHPSNSAATEIETLGATVSAKRLTLANKISALKTATFPSSQKLSRYVRARVAALGGRAALIRFINDVQGLVNQSATSFALVNHFYSQLYAVVNGGQADFTLSEAEAEIAQIINSRSQQEAAARNLNHPTAKSKLVADRLVEAFAASLANDNALSDCLYQSNNGTTAIIYDSCLSSTTALSAEATKAKKAFVAAYNQLRATVGLPPVQPRF